MAYEATIYSLSDDKGIVFYVGYTCEDIKVRVAAHYSEARRFNSPTAYNINKRKAEIIARVGDKMVVTILEVMGSTGMSGGALNYKARKREKYWIQKHLDEGCPLTNRQAAAIKYTIVNKATA